uniref:C2 domain-containing protein 3 isoform X2 n=1 Tax=Myxine glutinosa TaxID=7769 RepID=UPI00358F5501
MRSKSARKADMADAMSCSSLPPLVEGQLRCYLRVSLGRLVWKARRKPSFPLTPLVRLRWWGETKGGTLLHPTTITMGQGGTRNVKSSVRYAVRCGSKQLISYLADMGSLMLEVLSRTDQLALGKVQIHGLATLSVTNPIQGSFPIISPSSEKLGDLQAKLTLEPSSEKYSDGDSEPMTNSKLPNPVTSGPSSSCQSVNVTEQSNGKFQDGPEREPVGSTLSSVSRDKDHTRRITDHAELRKQDECPGDNLPSVDSRPVSATDPFQMPLEDCHPEPQSAMNSSSYGAHLPVKMAPDSPAANDLISELLSRGDCLRNAMALSAVQTEPLDMDGVDSCVPTLPSPSYTTGDHLLENILTGYDLDSPGNAARQLGPEPWLTSDLSKEVGQDIELRAIELLLGNDSSLPDNALLHDWEGLTSGARSPSEPDLAAESDLTDPLHDESLLEQLFYNAPIQGIDGGVRKKGSSECLIGGAPPKHQDYGSTPSLKHSGFKSSREHGSSPSTGTSSPLSRGRRTRLSPEQRARLYAVNKARVYIEELRLSPRVMHCFPAQYKPACPTSAHKEKCTYFVEYLFPVFPATEEAVAVQAGARMDPTRVASGKIVGNAVRFQQRTTFPVHLNDGAIVGWWNLELEFKVYSRQLSQRKPFLLGIGFFPLHPLLLTDDLSLGGDVTVKKHADDNIQGPETMGTLKVALELVSSEGQDSKRALSQTERVHQHLAYSKASMETSVAPDGDCQKKDPSIYLSQHASSARGRFPSRDKTPSRELRFDHAAHSPAASVTYTPRKRVKNFEAVAKAVRDEEIAQPVLLHVLLQVENGKGLQAIRQNEGSSSTLPNPYLMVKLFSSSGAIRSNVCWGSTSPQFILYQVVAIKLTQSLLNRMRNNTVVIEVWSKGLSPQRDALIGLVKLPLQQFYTSFRDPELLELLLQAHYPMVSTDGDVPIEDVFSGNCVGTLRALLAMGSVKQIEALRQMRVQGEKEDYQLQDDVCSRSSSQQLRQGESMVEHTFEVGVVAVRSLSPLQEAVWGEADCYVQYYFPVQSSLKGVADLGRKPVESFSNAGAVLRPFRTSTTLCVPNPVFGAQRTHHLQAPVGLPIQRLLLAVCSGHGRENATQTPSMGLPFEVWCKYYYPHVREQLVGRGSFPLANLCALATSARLGNSPRQTFNLPLTPRAHVENEPQGSPGLLEITLAYHCSAHSHLPKSRLCDGSDYVSLSVTIHRATGLQAAVRLAAEHDASLQPVATAGVVCRVSFHTSFMQTAEGGTITPPAQRSFCPDFGHSTSVRCATVVTGSAGQSVGLAEILQTAHIVFMVYHCTFLPGFQSSEGEQRTVLGKATVPLSGLITRTSGIRGWFPLHPAEELRDVISPSLCIGGLDLTMTFGHSTDRDRVLEVAKCLGWYPKAFQEERVEDASLLLVVSIPKAWIPLSIWRTECGHILRYCYVRYKLFEAGPVCSRPRKPGRGDTRRAAVTFRHRHSFAFDLSRKLLWFLREELLEVQMWVGEDANVPETSRPLDSDSLLGSAFLDLSSLAQGGRTVGGVFPIFKDCVCDLGGAALRVNVACRIKGSDCENLSEYSHGEFQQEVGTNSSGTDEGTNVHATMSVERNRQGGEKYVVLTENEDTFVARIVVERAMHLSVKGDQDSSVEAAGASWHVSCTVAGQSDPIRTAAVAASHSPVWECQLDVRLPVHLLYDRNKNLVFKVCYETGGTERVLGFAPVALSPLRVGFPGICGWYNIYDLGSTCRGLLKVSVTPLQDVSSQESFSKVDSDLCPAGQQHLLLKSVGHSSQHFIKAEIPRHQHEVREDKQEWIMSRGRFEEHLANVRRFHESLQLLARPEEAAATSPVRNVLGGEGAGPLCTPLRASLERKLRRHLDDLDNIRRSLHRRLIPKNADPVRQMMHPKELEVEGLGRAEEGNTVEREITDDPSENFASEDPEVLGLLERSNRLVSEVSSIMTDFGIINTGSAVPRAHGACVQKTTLDAYTADNLLDGASPDDILSRTEMALFKPENFLQAVGHLHRATVYDDELDKEHRSLVQEVRTCSHDVLDEKDVGQDVADAMDVLDEYFAGDFEEDLIVPRMLNDVSCSTDKTSPWSSVLSVNDTHLDFEDIDVEQKKKLDKKEEETSAETQTGEASEVDEVESLKDEEDGDSSTDTVRVSHTDLTPNSSVEEVDRQPEEICDQSEVLLPFQDCEELENHGDALSSAGAHQDASEIVEHDIPGGFGEHAVENRVLGEAKHVSTIDKTSVTAMQVVGSPDTTALGHREAHGTFEEARPGSSILDKIMVPNFFLPPEDLKASMRALRLEARRAAMPDTSESTSSHPARFRHPPASSLPPATAARIAKIFSGQTSKPD